MIRCGQARRRILASRDARLSLGERLELDEHLAGCEMCRALDEADAGLEEALATLPEPPVEQLDLDAAVRAVGGRIDALERERSVPRVRWRRPLVVAAAAAALGLVTLGLWLWRQADVLPSAVPASSGRSSDRVAGSGADPSSVRAADPDVPNQARSTGLAENETEQPESLAQARRNDPGTGRPGTERHGAERVAEERPADAVEPVPLELDRLESARATAREAFAQAVPSAPGSLDDAGALDARLAAAAPRLAELARTGWPVTRLAERVLADPDPEVAGLATRWLGRNGDRLSIVAIGSLLDRPDAPVELRRQAVRALLEDGPSGIEKLAPALHDPALGSLALDGLAARGGPDVVRLLAGELSAARGDDEAAAALAHTLSLLGDAGLDALLDVAFERGAAAGCALRQLRSTRGARERLAALLAERASGRIEEARLSAAAQLGLPEALPLLAARALDRGGRDRALENLAAFAGPGALTVVLDLWSSGRLVEDDLAVAARAQLERDPEQAVALCDELEAQAKTPRLAQLLDLLLASESRAAAAGLARLVASPWLDRDARQWAALALASLGSAAQVPVLADVLDHLGPDDARLAAACALAIHALGGPDALREALGPTSSTRAGRLLTLYESRPVDRNQAVTLSRASRLLEPWLEPENPERRTSP